MPLRVLRFRRFSVRLLVLLLALLFAALGGTYLLVSRVNEQTALAHAEASLAVGAHLFDDTVRQRIAYLAGSASVMTGDYAIKTVLQADHPDAATLSSTLKSYTRRVNAPVIALFDTDGRLMANSDAGMDNENCGPFAFLIRLATEQDRRDASGFAYLNHALHVLVVVPLYAPYPNIAAWFGLAFPIDHAFAQNLKDTTRIEITFLATDEAAPRVLVTTLPDAAARLIPASAAPLTHAGRPAITALAGARHLTLVKMQDLLGDAPIAIILQRPLNAELAAARDLEQRILLISLAALALATLAALWIARGVSQPVHALAAHTKLVAAGDYSARLDLDRADELGQLATAFNAMTAGLAERDRIRDLLDKNVSPEVAAQLLRDGAALGGEEREVTILFADLRGFTTLSEQLAPRDLLALLNRYLDRMSAEIERRGGVIDKFIGDAIMALFGAPVAQSDAAVRAVAAALAMETALAALNAELAAEGRPPLALGIGINTARVVAGNIGSHRRLNYSVIGDGVNVAARLQSLTRTPEYHTNLLASAATVAAVRSALSAPRSPNSDLRSPTFRPLGTVPVKGRAEPVEIFAIE